ncbi:heme exporter protein CcmD [Rhodobacter sp. NSM]|uniref:heme exporter protein CcmD n=1 Tax=Rhodobacter sp. NSM TaxID=3457501 RepID=UPI003FD28F7E
MIPDLGKYAFSVLTAYGASITLLAGLVVMSLWRGARVRRMLREVERRQGRTDG